MSGEVTVLTDARQPLPDIPTSYERFAVLLVFSALTLYMAYTGNSAAMTMAAANISTYFLSRTGA